VRAGRGGGHGVDGSDGAHGGVGGGGGGVSSSALLTSAGLAMSARRGVGGSTVGGSMAFSPSSTALGLGGGGGGAMTLSHTAEAGAFGAAPSTTPGVFVVRYALPTAPGAAITAPAAVAATLGSPPGGGAATLRPGALIPPSPSLAASSSQLGSGPGSGSEFSLPSAAQLAARPTASAGGLGDGKRAAGVSRRGLGSAGAGGGGGGPPTLMGGGSSGRRR
jgi:hypothetical protein